MITTVILDFDDTLAESLPPRVAALNRCLQEVVGRTVTEAQALAVFRGGSSIESQMAAFAPEPALAPVLVETYRRHYYRLDRPPLTTYPGLPDALAALRAAGIGLAMVTSRYRAGANGDPTRSVVWELDRMGLRDAFGVIVGYEDSAEHKPSAEPFLAALRQLAVPAGTILAVGDAPWDIVGARTAGMLGGAALWGANDRDALLAANADHVLHTPAALLQAVLGGH